MFYPAFLGGALEWIKSPVDGTIVALLLFFIGWATKKWLLPVLSTAARKKVAEYVLVIADEVTDWLVAKYPDKDFYEYLDKAVDKIMEVCGVSKPVAERAAAAALGRKRIVDSPVAKMAKEKK